MTLTFPPQVFDSKIRPYLDIAHIHYDITPTEYAGHAIEMGKTYDPAKYEGVIFVRWAFCMALYCVCMYISLFRPVLQAYYSKNNCYS